MVNDDFEATRHFREMARLLREQVLERGVELAEGAAEGLLAQQIRDIAPKAGLTEWQAASSVTRGMITALADDVRVRASTYLDAVAATEPISLSVANAGRIIGGIGLVTKTAARNSEKTRTESMDAILTAADVLSTLGDEIHKAIDSGSDSFSLGGLDLTRTRKVLTEAIDMLRDSVWDCPAGPHSDRASDESCPLTAMLTVELEFLGGWPSPRRD